MIESDGRGPEPGQNATEFQGRGLNLGREGLAVSQAASVIARVLNGSGCRRGLRSGGRAWYYCKSCQEQPICGQLQAAEAKALRV